MAFLRTISRSLDHSQDQLLGEFERNGFETHAELRDFSVDRDLLVTAEAVDANGKVLTRTKPVVARAEVQVSLPEEFGRIFDSEEL